MPSYRVSFINPLPKGERLFRCCQRSILIRSAKSPERAIEAAKRRFMRLEGVGDWRIRAAEIELERLIWEEGANAAAAQSSATRKKARRRKQGA